MFKSHSDYRKAWDDAYLTDPPIPLNVDLELSSVCNSRCPFCLFGNPEWVKSLNGKMMPMDMAMSIIHECMDLGVPALKFQYRGESTLHPDFSDILYYARSLKVGRLEKELQIEFKKIEQDRIGGQVIKNITPSKELEEAYKSFKPAFHDILINTNANCPDKSIDGLMACTKVMVSLDSLDPKIYPKIRVGLSLDRAKEVITELIRRKHPNLWVRRVKCKENEGEDFIEKCQELWGDKARYSEHYAFERNKYSSQSLHGENPAEWERKYCSYPSQRVVITASGDYLPCCLSWSSELIMGNYKNMSIKQYWDSGPRKRLVGELKNNIFKNKLCQNCTSFVSYKRPESRFVQDIEGVAKI